MATAHDNEPAFPVQYISKTQFPGMTLRDYFAAKAMPMAYDYVRRIDPDGRPVTVSESDHRLNTYCFQWDEDGGGDCDMVAEWAYAMADAMLRARVL